MYLEVGLILRLGLGLEAGMEAELVRRVAIMLLEEAAVVRTFEWEERNSVIG